jgi:hypothetical protein
MQSSLPISSKMISAAGPFFKSQRGSEIHHSPVEGTLGRHYTAFLSQETDPARELVVVCGRDGSDWVGQHRMPPR